jgi:hypothetical protein
MREAMEGTLLVVELEVHLESATNINLRDRWSLWSKGNRCRNNRIREDRVL